MRGEVSRNKRVVEVRILIPETQRDVHLQIRGEVSRNKRVIEEEEGILEDEEGEQDSDSLSKRCEAYQTAVAMGKMVNMIEESLMCVIGCV